MDMDKITVSGDDAVELSDIRNITRANNGDDTKTAMCADKDSGPGNEGQPFHTTHLGKVPPEIREKMFIHLLALPPPYAGRDIAIQDPNTRRTSVPNEHQTSSNTPCYHLRNSCLDVLQTCRQIYTEAFPLFYGGKSYYAANAQELAYLLMFGRAGAPGPLAFRGDRITSLCVKDVVRRVTSSPTEGPLDASSFLCLDSTVRFATSKLSGWDNLRKICLCMVAGVEMIYIEFMFLLPGMRYGVIEFLDDSHWSIYLQNPGSKGNIQYAGNTHGLKKFSHATFSHAAFYACRWKEEFDAKASSLEEKGKRYVEVDVTRLTKEAVKAVKAAMESAGDIETLAP